MGLRWPVVLAIVAVLALLGWRRVGMLAWTLAWWVAFYLFFEFGFVMPIPASVVLLYMAIATVSLLAYVASSPERWESFRRPILRLVLEARYKSLLTGILVLVPCLVALNVYVKSNVPLQAPLFARAIHPAPPDTITVHEREIDLNTSDNPHRRLEQTDLAAFRLHVENGRRVYFQNCFFCHGEAMAADGMFAHGLNPLPTDFTDQGVLPMLQETFVFWRVAKGGPGMPEEGGPWDSAMPAFESFLTEDEIWDVILYLYEYTGYRPWVPEGGP